jgi:hypothetical protein
MRSTLELQQLGPADWWILRSTTRGAVGLDAFTSSYAQESEWGEQEWQRLFDAATCIVAREAENVVGMVRSVTEPERPETPHLESAWVAPSAGGFPLCSTPLLRSIA